MNGREYIEQLGRALEDSRRTIKMPDGTVFDRAEAIDYVLDIWVEQSGPIVPPGWRFSTTRFELLALSDGAIQVNPTTTYQRSPCWVVTDVACSDPHSTLRVKTQSGYVSTFSGPWIVDGIRLENPIATPMHLPTLWTLDAHVLPNKIALRGFIGFQF